jgi:cell division septum initiation protein DivIVA
VVGRNEVLDLLDSVRMMLPTAVQEAEVLLADRAGVIEDGYQQAERAVGDANAQAQAILEQATAQQAALVSEHQVTEAALDQAAQIRAQAEAEADAIQREAIEQAEAMRREVDAYIDERFAAFEASLTKTLATVQRSRERLRERYPSADQPER